MAVCPRGLSVTVARSRRRSVGRSSIFKKGHLGVTSQPRWRLPRFSVTCFETSPSANGSSQSSPMRLARSVWTRCFVSSRFTHLGASFTSPSTTTSCSRTPKAATDKYLKKASPNAGRPHHGSPQGPLTPTPVFPWCRFTPSIRCLVSSESETRCGLPLMPVPEDSSLGPRPDAQP